MLTEARFAPHTQICLVQPTPLTNKKHQIIYFKICPTIGLNESYICPPPPYKDRCLIKPPLILTQKEIGQQIKSYYQFTRKLNRLAFLLLTTEA